MENKNQTDMSQSIPRVPGVADPMPRSQDGSADIIKLIENLFESAHKNRASDIHIEPREKNTHIRFRIDGEFMIYADFPSDLSQAILTRVCVISGLKIDETRLPQDGKITTRIGGKDIDMRVSTFPTMYGDKIVIRILEKDQRAKTLEELGYKGKPLEVMKRNLKRTYGMILMTGPTGSGKSTTLFSMLSSFNPEKYNIVTLEDPIEYVIKGANQAQIRTEIGFDFADGLRSIVRQDPNIIMIGEIRDDKSANLAIQAALTGHLVFSTVHANTAAHTVQRLANMKVDNFLVTSALNLIVSQRLVRKNCDACKTPYIPPTENLEDIKDLVGGETNLKQIKFMKGKGCRKCGNTGYFGRIAIYEVLEITPSIQKIILENPIASAIEAQAVKEGMLTIKQNGLIKVNEGFTTLEEILLAVDEARNG